MENLKTCLKASIFIPSLFLIFTISSSIEDSNSHVDTSLVINWLIPSAITITLFITGTVASVYYGDKTSVILIRVVVFEVVSIWSYAQAQAIASGHADAIYYIILAFPSLILDWLYWVTTKDDEEMKYLAKPEALILWLIGLAWGAQALSVDSDIEEAVGGQNGNHITSSLTPNLHLQDKQPEATGLLHDFDSGDTLV
ncbi:hypothetical protein JVU11DRAFT_7405 [Chiua virens]|nr:hypothetical protein JVU11DRAFT_7405 [Chiua virens]